MKQTLLILSFIFINTCLSGQDTLNRHYRILITPSQFIFNDYSISAEKFFKGRTIGITLGYKPSTKSGGEISGGHGLLGIYKDQNMWNGLYEAVTFGINSKYYFKRNKRFFGDLALFYRYWWFEKKYAKFDNVEGYRFDGLRTEQQNVVGMKLLAGYSTYILKGNKGSIIIDFYVGIGLRYKSLWFRTYDGFIYKTYHDFYSERSNHFSVGPQAGFKIGYKINLLN